MVGKMNFNFGDLVLLAASYLSDCTVSGTVVVKGHVKLIVSLKNAYGSPIVEQSVNISISCYEENFMKHLHIEEEAQGRYLISYNPRRIENHFVLVSWGVSITKPKFW